MSEQVFAAFLRLYPAAFRARHGNEAMQLFRDRLHNERGLLRRLRMWLDLAADLVFTVAAEACAPRKARMAALAVKCADGAPSFQVLDEAAPRGSALFLGAAFSLMAFGSVTLWLGHVHNSRLLHLWIGPAKGAAPIRAVAFGIPLRQAIVGGFADAPAQPAQPVVEDATAAMIRAFDEHNIVMFGETHANKQEYEWLCKLVNTDDFADRVDDIVVEFGNSLYQKSVDRYIAGDDVPYEQVEKAWRNMVGAVGAPSPVYEAFYKAVRASNTRRRGRHAMRIVLGDPYGDWDRIKDAEDLGPYVAHRDEWYAQVVKDEVLAKQHRALLIMGAGHFRRVHGPGGVEREIRAAGANPYLVVFGTNAVGGYGDLDKRFEAWPLPAMVPLAGNWVGELPAMPVLTGGVVAPTPLKLAEAADALLYVGPRDGLTQVNMTRAELENTPYGKELERRLAMVMERPADFPGQRETPQYARPLPQSNPSSAHGMMVAPPKSMHDPLPARPPSQ